MPMCTDCLVKTPPESLPPEPLNHCPQCDNQLVNIYRNQQFNARYCDNCKKFI